MYEYVHNMGAIKNWETNYVTNIIHEGGQEMTIYSLTDNSTEITVLKSRSMLVS
jgi:hypothetical protein